MAEGFTAIADVVHLIPPRYQVQTRCTQPFANLGTKQADTWDLNAQKQLLSSVRKPMTPSLRRYTRAYFRTKRFHHKVSPAV
eukprot:1195510-Prorocentrum_minimum.AAC.5